jgi:hypothetical protein
MSGTINQVGCISVFLTAIEERIIDSCHYNSRLYDCLNKRA